MSESKLPEDDCADEGIDGRRHPRVHHTWRNRALQAESDYDAERARNVQLQAQLEKAQADRDERFTRERVASIVEQAREEERNKVVEQVRPYFKDKEGRDPLADLVELRAKLERCQVELARRDDAMAQLQRILGDLFPIEHAEPGMLTARFEDGTRLSFIGNDGRLNGVVIQREDVPALRLHAQPAPVHPERRRDLAQGALVPIGNNIASAAGYVAEPSACDVCGCDLLPTLRMDTSPEKNNAASVCLGCLQAIVLHQAMRSS
jgi:hypothetical protein